METLMKKDLMGRLEDCNDENLIDGILDEIGFVVDITKRNAYLMDYMGVKGAFSSNVDVYSDIELQYSMTKEAFVDGDWKYMSGRKFK
ncbi:MAG: hypothetical protein FWG91_12635 [Lachnospiraceae bacterium]|nr:hypothetical protein [Lachnospiraceae bacterium]